MDAKRLEELRLNDTIFITTINDMHFYDGRKARSTNFIIFFSIIIIITSYIGCVDASSVLTWAVS
jgi:hypothetical protein